MSQDFDTCLALFLEAAPDKNGEESHRVAMMDFLEKASLLFMGDDANAESYRRWFVEWCDHQNSRSFGRLDILIAAGHDTAEALFQDFITLPARHSAQPSLTPEKRQYN